MDYDFSDVEKSELFACFWYEYARESRAVIAEVGAAKKQLKEAAGKSQQMVFGARVRNQIQSHILMGLALAEDFPALPWKNISDKGRKNFLKFIALLPHVTFYAMTWQNPPLIFLKNEPGEMTLDKAKQKFQEGRPEMFKNDPVKFGFFAVNMKYSRLVLIQEFAKWITSFEGKAMSETPPFEKEFVKSKKPRGRNTFRDELNALAVMRLRCCCNSFAEAQKKMEPLKRKTQGMFYTHRSSANRACDLALHQFKQLFGWLDSKNPIHFSKGWRGGEQK